MKDRAADLPVLLRALRLDRALRLVWRSARGWTLLNGALVLLQGVIPLVSLYLVKRIVDGVTKGIATQDKALAFAQVLPWILVAGGTALLGILCRSFGELAAESQAQVVTDDVSDILHAQSIAVDLEYYEDPRYHDALHNAQREAPYRPTRIVNGLIQIGQNGLALLGIAALLISFNWMLGLLVVAVAVPASMVRLIYSRRLYAITIRQTEIERRAWYYHWMMTDPGHAKEIRLFDLGSLFRRRYRDLRQQLRWTRLALFRRRAVSDFLAQALATAAIFCAFGLVAYRAVLGGISLGALVMYYQGFQSGLGFLQSVLRGLAGIYEDNLFLSNFYQFLELSPRIRAPRQPRPVPDPARAGIAFRDVAFEYPGTGHRALEAIDLRVRPGEVIALVGENGSGKTTLIKLLCRLYDTTAGSITYDDVDLRELDPVRWRREISVAFQDYVHYSLTARENIWFGNVEDAADDERIERAARLSGADAAIRRLPEGYDTPLGHWFEQGRELSIGEWQKVALARSFMREARIVVLDEPTSSLDPLAEAELFHKFRDLIRGRSAILISHRFSTVRMADCIYVLEGGRIVERGSHPELLRRGGGYARLYQAQADYYREDRVDA